MESNRYCSNVHVVGRCRHWSPATVWKPRLMQLLLLDVFHQVVYIRAFRMRWNKLRPYFTTMEWEIFSVLKTLQNLCNSPKIWYPWMRCYEVLARAAIIRTIMSLSIQWSRLWLLVIPWHFLCEFYNWKRATCRLIVTILWCIQRSV